MVLILSLMHISYKPLLNQIGDSILMFYTAIPISSKREFTTNRTAKSFLETWNIYLANNENICG